MKGNIFLVCRDVVFRQESIEWFTEDQAFSLSYDLAPPPLPLLSKLDRKYTERLRNRDNLLNGWGRGGGGGGGHMTARKRTWWPLTLWMSVAQSSLHNSYRSRQVCPHMRIKSLGTHKSAGWAHLMAIDFVKDCGTVQLTKWLQKQTNFPPYVNKITWNS